MEYNRVQLVISAPSAHIAPLSLRAKCRTTIGAITQLLASAETEVTIAAPFLQGGYGLSSGPMADALLSALGRGVRVDLLSTGSSLASIDVWNIHPGRGRLLRVFRPSANLDDNRYLGSHAKLCVADWRVAYIGSANFTRPGLMEQVEVGTLLEGPIVSQLRDFWWYCMEQGLFKEVFPEEPCS
jgi:phosphatidylserine/phosphatidylglycerophosphate/cardiolipin synthase-like enzyme